MNVCTVKSNSICTPNIKVNVPKRSREVKQVIPWGSQSKILKEKDCGVHRPDS